MQTVRYLKHKQSLFHLEVCVCLCVSFSLSASLAGFLLTGQSGLGKSTLMNTLFKSKVSRKSVLAMAQEKIPKTIEIKSISHGMPPLDSSLCPLYLGVFCLSVFVGLSAKIHSSHPLLLCFSSLPFCIYAFPHGKVLHTAYLLTPNFYSIFSFFFPSFL